MKQSLRTYCLLSQKDVLLVFKDHSHIRYVKREMMGSFGAHNLIFTPYERKIELKNGTSVYFSYPDAYEFMRGRRFDLILFDENIHADIKFMIRETLRPKITGIFNEESYG